MKKILSQLCDLDFQYICLTEKLEIKDPTTAW